MEKRSLEAILETNYPAEYEAAAMNAIDTCLQLQPKERFVMITDEASLPIGASILDHVKKVTKRFDVFVLEDFGMRPMRHMPKDILDALYKAKVSIYACTTQTGELQHRIEMMDVINLNCIRHGHMVNITHDIMLVGMNADFHKVDEISTRLIEKTRKASRITAKTPKGTDLVAEFSPHLNWVKTSGIISPEKWGNLPGGEIFTSPTRVNGTFVVDGVVGDYLCSKYGDLKDSPLEIIIEDSRIVKCFSENTELLEEFVQYCMTDENSNRVGEFAIGTNIALDRVIGNILQDEKLPGIHIAFGYPYCEHTGAKWRSSTHIDVVGRDFDIWVEDEQVMERGKFIF
ncbi:MAG: aminopeptidase [Ectothiorhodospiraceae bacterium]|nr:aminopeptidase [Ectothiorhodospiraceae bacterium]